MPRLLLLSALLTSILVGRTPVVAQGVGNGIIAGAESLNVRAGPGTEHAATGTLRSGDAVAVLGRQGKWAQIRHRGGEGWVFASFISMPAGAAPVPPTPTPQLLPTGTPIGDSALPQPPGPANAAAVVDEPVADGVADDIRSDVERILTLTEAMHHDLERRRNTPPRSARADSGVGLQSGIGLLALGGVIGFLIGTILARQQERSGRSRVRF